MNCDFDMVERMNANAICVHGHVASRALYQAAIWSGTSFRARTC